MGQGLSMSARREIIKKYARGYAVAAKKDNGQRDFPGPSQMSRKEPLKRFHKRNGCRQKLPCAQVVGSVGPRHNLTPQPMSDQTDPSMVD